MKPVRLSWMYNTRGGVHFRYIEGSNYDHVTKHSIGA